MIVAGCCGVARAESDKVIARLIDIVRVAVTDVRLWARVPCCHGVCTLPNRVGA